MEKNVINIIKKCVKEIWAPKVKILERKNMKFYKNSKLSQVIQIDSIFLRILCKNKVLFITKSFFYLSLYSSKNVPWDLICKTGNWEKRYDVMMNESVEEQEQ